MEYRQKNGRRARTGPAVSQPLPGSAVIPLYVNRLSDFADPVAVGQGLAGRDVDIASTSCLQPVDQEPIT
jgi:hypothetical protein